MGDRKIRVLVVDDSALARRLIIESLATFPDIEVVGTAADPYVARDKILELKPDVVTLDIEMPRMDGLTFLKLIMRHRPMPVIVVSSLTDAGSRKAMEAIECGAVDVMGKPAGAYSAHTEGTVLAQKIRAAAVARVTKPSAMREPVDSVVDRMKIGSPPRSVNPRSLIVMGASTGGTEALKQVLTRLPGDLPGVCVVQHIPAQFSGAFANRLNSLCVKFIVRVRRA
jgi:two-component system, chemotaxis family, protein-glutamate methylesterase/glutaminase